MELGTMTSFARTLISLSLFAGLSLSIPDSGFIVPGKGNPPAVDPFTAIPKDFNVTNSTSNETTVNVTTEHQSTLRTGWRPVAHAAHQDIVVPRNGRRRIELLEEFTIPDGESELLLPIEVAPKRLTIDGDAAPRVLVVNSTALDGEYGAGHEINITILYTASVAWTPIGVSDGNRWVGSVIDVPERWVLSGTDKHMVGSAYDALGQNTQWSDGEHPTSHPVKANATIPTLRLATGCQESPSSSSSNGCAIPEIQMFRCAADSGSITLSWNGVAISNVDVRTDQENLKRLLQTLPGVTRVTVSYSTPMDDAEAMRMCTSRGNNVTVTFEDASVPPFHSSQSAASGQCQDVGDLPELEFDQYNAPQDQTTGLSQGDGTFLHQKYNELFDDFLLHGRPLPADVDGVVLSPKAIELRKGWKAPDRLARLVAIEDDDVRQGRLEEGASYLFGNDGGYDNDAATAAVGFVNRSRLIFSYVVCQGDSTSDLEYRGANSLQGEGLVDAVTGNSIDLLLPRPGAGGSYRHHEGESLGARRSIQVDTSVPQVLYVASPLNDGMYGEGDAIVIDVVFDRPVTVGLVTESSNAFGGDEDNEEGTGENHDDIRVEHEERRGVPFVHVVVGRMSEALGHAHLSWYPPPETKGQYVHLRKAYYASTHHGNTVRFRYLVQDLDYSLRLDYAHQHALHLNGGWIRRSATTPTTDALLLLPPPGGLNSLAGTKKIIIYPLPARVVNVAVKAGSYGAFEAIKIEVQFGWGLLAGWRGSNFLPIPRALTNRYGVPVTLSEGATPYLELRVDMVPMANIWSMRNGSSSLVLVQGHSLDASWAVGVQFELSVGYTQGEMHKQVVTVTNATNDLVHFEPPWVGGSVLSSQPPGNVTTLDVRNATYLSGNNTDTLTFEYVVLPGDRTQRLDYTSSRAFKLSPANATLLRLAHRPSTKVNTTLVEPGTCSAEALGCSLGPPESAPVELQSEGVEIEGRSQSLFRPRVLSLSTTKSSSQGPYGVGEPIEVVVSFSAPVAVSSNGSSAPVLRLSPGGFAAYAYGSGSANLTFWYVVGEGDDALVLDSYTEPYAHGFDPAEYRMPPHLDIFFLGQGQGWIRRDSSQPLTPALLELPTPGEEGSLTRTAQVSRASSDAALSVNGTTATAAVVVDLPITVCTDQCAHVEKVECASPPNSVLGAGAHVNLSVHFSDLVQVNTTGGLPYIELHLGVPVGDDVDEDSSSSGSSNEDSGVVDEIALATYVSGSGTRVLMFSYIVAQGDPYTNPLIVYQRRGDLTRTTSIQRGGGSVLTVGTGRDAVLTLRRLSRVHALNTLSLDMTTSRSNFGASDPFTQDPSRTLRQQGIVVDTNPATIHTVEAILPEWTKIYGQTLGAGEKFYIHLHFTATVVVFPTNESSAYFDNDNAMEDNVTTPTPVFRTWPELELETSGYHRSIATYVGGSGSKILRFMYQTLERDFTADLDYRAFPHSFRGGTILTQSNSPVTPANRTLPMNGAPGSLGYEANVKIDTTPATVVAVLSPLPANTYGLPTALQTVEIAWAAAEPSSATTLATSAGAADDDADDDDDDFGAYASSFAFSSSSALPDQPHQQRRPRASLVSGGFKLSYGSSTTTQCLSWNASAAQVQRALRAFGPLHSRGQRGATTLFENVTVVDAEAPHDGARRFVVDLSSLGEGVLAGGGQALRPLMHEPECALWRCSVVSLAAAAAAAAVNNSATADNSDHKGVAAPCPAVSGEVVEFRDNGFGERHGAFGGFVDVTLRFDRAVVVDVASESKQPPSIGLNLLHWNEYNSSASSYRPNATYAPGATVQVIDVGVFASAPLTAGQFRLSYGRSSSSWSSSKSSLGFLATGCIDYEAANSAFMSDALDHEQEVAHGGERNLRARLEALGPIAAIGLVSVTATPLGNGTRFRVHFTPGSNPDKLEPLQLLQPLSGDGDGEECQPFSPSDANVTLPPSADVTFRYEVKAGDVAFPNLRVSTWDTRQPLVDLGGLSAASTIRTHAFSGNALIDAKLEIPTDVITPHPSMNGGVAPFASFDAYSPGPPPPAPVPHRGEELVVDCSPGPVVANITTGAWGDEYGVNEWIDFWVTFTGPVVASPGTLLYLDTGHSELDSVARLYPNRSPLLLPGFEPIPQDARGNGTTTLRFHYRVGEGDATRNLVPSSPAALSGKITSALFTQWVYADTDLRWTSSNVSTDKPSSTQGLMSGTTATASASLSPKPSHLLPRNYTVDGKALVLNTERPYVVSVVVDKPRNNGTFEPAYTVGEEIFVRVVFSKAVSLKGRAFLRLNSGGVAELFERNAGNLQVFDVGVDATMALQHFCCGKFRLGYDNGTTTTSSSSSSRQQGSGGSSGGDGSKGLATTAMAAMDETRCMQWDNAKSVERGVHTLPGLMGVNGLLDPWPAPFVATGIDLHGGYRWTLEFPNGGGDYRPYPHPLTALNPEDHMSPERWSSSSRVLGTEDEDDDDDDPFGLGDTCTTLAPPYDLSARVKPADTNVLAFRYVVQPGDSSFSLGVAAGPGALMLEPEPEAAERLATSEAGGGSACLSPPAVNLSTYLLAESYIRRAANVRPVQDANLTIPYNLSVGGGSSGVVVNGTGPRVVDVQCVSGIGPFTEGDVLEFKVKFSAPVWLVHLESGTDVSSGLKVAAEGTGVAPEERSSKQSRDAEEECEGLAESLDVLSLALATFRTIPDEGTLDFDWNRSSTTTTTNLTSSNSSSSSWLFAEDATARARYTNGSGTSELFFKYAVRPNEATDGSLDYPNGTSLQPQLGHGVLGRSTASQVSADLRLPSPGTRGSLSHGQNVTLYPSSRPQTAVEYVTADVPEGCYDPGKLIHIHVVFSRCVATPNNRKAFPSSSNAFTTALELTLVTGTPAASTTLTAAFDSRGRAFARMLVFPWVVGRNEHTLRVVTRPDSLRLVRRHSSSSSGPPGTVVVAALPSPFSSFEEDDIRVLPDSRWLATNTTLAPKGMEGSLDHSVIIAVHHGDHARVREPEPLPTPKAPRAIGVNSSTTEGRGAVYGAGTMMLFDVHFDFAVTVHCVGSSSGHGLACPGLVLRTNDGPGGGVHSGEFEWADWSVMSVAPYVSGNNTHTLTFRYDVAPGHTSLVLDYVDTRPAAHTQRYSRALILPCECSALVDSSQSCARGVGGEGVVAARIVRARDPHLPGSAPVAPEVNAITFLPVPNATGSIGALGIAVDTSAPTVVGVTTPARDAVYEPTELVSEAGFPDWESAMPHWPSDDPFDDFSRSWTIRNRLAIDVHFSAPVAVATLESGAFGTGCALELAMDVAVHRFLSSNSGKSVAGSNGALRYAVGGRRAAVWSGEGNGTSTLRFRLPIFPGDYSPLLDYSASPHALSVVCEAPEGSSSGGGRASQAASHIHDSEAAVFRVADPRLVTPADLTLPPPGKRATKASPGSLVGSGHRVAIQGDTCCRVEELQCVDDAPNTNDDVNDDGSSSGWDTFGEGKRPKRHPSTVQGFYTGMPLVVTVRFAEAVRVRSPTSVLDSGPVLHLKIADASFVNGSRHFGHGNVTSLANNATALYEHEHVLSRGGRGPVPVVEATYSGGNNTDTLEFTYVVQAGDSAGYLEVANSSALLARVGEIVFVAALAKGPGYNHRGNALDETGLAFATLPDSFPPNAFALRPVNTRLPLWPAAVSLGRSCRATVDGSAPHVVQVRLGKGSSGSGGGVFTSGERIYVVVVFSAPVALAGTATLALDVLPNDPSGFKVAATSSALGPQALHKEIVFEYVPSPGHVSPALNYTNRNALHGNFTARFAPDQEADLLLPPIANSLPAAGSGSNKEAVAVVDTASATVVSVTFDAPPTCGGVYGAGEEALVTVTFDHPVVLVGAYNSSSHLLAQSELFGHVMMLANKSAGSNGTSGETWLAWNSSSEDGAQNSDADADDLPSYLTLELDVSGKYGNANATLVRRSLGALVKTGAKSVTFSATFRLGDGSSMVDYAHSMALRMLGETVDDGSASNHLPLTLARAPTFRSDDDDDDDGDKRESVTRPKEFLLWNASLAAGVELRLPERGTLGSLGESSAASGPVSVDVELDSRPFVWLVSLDRVGDFDQEGTGYAVYKPPAWLAESSGVDELIQEVYGTPDAIEDEDHTEIGVGDALHLRLRFTERVVVHGLPTFRLSVANNGGYPTEAVYISGNNTDELVFEYWVKGGDSDSCVAAAQGALRCGCVAPDCRIEGLTTSRARPRSELRGKAGGAQALQARLRLPLEWPSFTRHASLFLAEFRHTQVGPDAGGGTASWRHNTSSIVNVTTLRINGTRSDASRLLPAFLDALRDSTFFSSSLAAPSADLFSRFTTMSTRASSYDGEPATYEQAEGCVRVQTRAVSVLRVTTDHADGTWGAGEHITISVLFTGPVTLVDDSHLRLRLEVGDTVMDRTQGPVNATTEETDDQGTIKRRIAYADYFAGNNSARLRFLYVVEPNHLSVNLDVDASACRAVCISAGIGIDDFPFAPYSYPSGCHELLGEGANVSLYANFSQRPVDLATTFGDYDNFRAATALELRGRLVRRAAVVLDDVDLELPCPGTQGSLSRHHELVIDTRPPAVDFVVSLRHPDVYRAGETVDFQVVFDQPVTVSGPSGQLRLALNVRSTSLANATGSNNGTYGSSSNNNNNNTSGNTKATSLPAGTAGAWDFGGRAVMFANHDPGCRMRREGFSFEDRSVCFTYVVKHGDVAEPFLDYRSEHALELRFGAVYRTATVLTERALTLLPNHQDYGDEGLLGRGGVEAFQKVVAYQVTVAGLSHDDASDLQVGVEHSGKRATLLDYRLSKRADLRLGPSPAAAAYSASSSSFSDYKTPAQSPTPVPYSSPVENGTTSTPSPSMPWNTLRHASGGGSTFFFGDTAGQNLAAEGRACQSSTRFGAYAARAIDGSVNPYFVSGASVTHTGFGASDPAPWWQLSLRRPSPVGTIRVWARQPEVRVDEVQYVHVHAHTSLDGSGSFRLAMERTTQDGGVDVETSEAISVDAVSSRREESSKPAPPKQRDYPHQTTDRFFTFPDASSYCTPGTNCAGDSVQAKVEGLLAKVYPNTGLGNLRVSVERGRSHGTPAGQSAWVAHEITSATPDVDTAELPPTVVDVGAAPASPLEGGPKARSVRQKMSLPDSPPSGLHWDTLQGDYDRAWKVTFIGATGNVPPLSWPAGLGEDAEDGPPLNSRVAHNVGGLTAVGAHVKVATLRQGAHAPAPHGRDDRPRAVGEESHVNFRPGEGDTGPCWLMLFNTTEPPPRGLGLAETRRLAVWSTFIGRDAFAPLSADDTTGNGAGGGGASSANGSKKIEEGGGTRPVAVVRVPSIWAQHLRIQRGDRSDVVSDRVLAMQALAEKLAAGEQVLLETLTDESKGSAVERGGSRTPIEVVRERKKLKQKGNNGGGDDDGDCTPCHSSIHPNATGAQVSAEEVVTAENFYGFAPLAIAEVQVFEEVHAPVHEYVGSSPLPPSVLSAPLTPAIEPLATTFEGSPSAGRWMLSVRDRIASTRASLADDRGSHTKVGVEQRNEWDPSGWGRRRRVHGVGSVGRWELHLTDVLGYTHTFYMDTTLTVTALPKFGHLYVLGQKGEGTEGHRLDAMQDVADGTAELLLPVEGGEEWRGKCAGIDTTGMNGVDAARVYRECPDNFGVGLKKGMRNAGSVAARVPLRGGANTALVYVPRVDFTGPDVFQFKVQAGAGLAPTGLGAKSHDASVTMRVRECRKRGGPYFPADQLKALCACTSPLLFVEEAERLKCFQALVFACVGGNSSSSSSSSSGVGLSGVKSSGADASQNETKPESPVSFRSSGDGRCDATTGICAAGLPDKVVNDARPTTTSWKAAREGAATGFDRMCLACEGSPSFNRLRPRCWGEFLHAIHGYGIRAAVAGKGTCEADVRQRESFDQVRCDDDGVDAPTGHKPEPRLSLGRLDTGRF